MLGKAKITLSELPSYAQLFMEHFPSGGVFGLKGNLGAGKTTFVRHVIKALFVDKNKSAPRVTSPSFVLHQSHDYLSRPVEHFDLYRLDELDNSALIDLGYFDAVERAKNLKGFVFVEWPERVSNVENLLLEGILYIGFDDSNEEIRSFDYIS